MLTVRLCRISLSKYISVMVGQELEFPIFSAVTQPGMGTETETLNDKHGCLTQMAVTKLTLLLGLAVKLRLF